MPLPLTSTLGQTRKPGDDATLGDRVVDRKCQPAGPLSSTPLRSVPYSVPRNRTSFPKSTVLLARLCCRKRAVADADLVQQCDGFVATA